MLQVVRIPFLASQHAKLRNQLTQVDRYRDDMVRASLDPVETLLD